MTSYDLLYKSITDVLSTTFSYKFAEPNCDTTQCLAENVLMRAYLKMPFRRLAYLINEGIDLLDFHTNDSMIHGVYDHKLFASFCKRHREN